MLILLMLSYLSLGILILILLPTFSVRLITNVAWLTSLLVLFITTDLFIAKYYVSNNFSEVTHLTLIAEPLYYTVGFNLDGLALVFVFLTTLLSFLCLYYISYDINIKKYSILILIMEMGLLLTFTVTDILLFYIFFESILVPMLLLIGFFGSRERKMRANYLLFFYTIFGSLFFLLGIIYIYLITGTLNLEILQFWSFSTHEQLLLWLAFFFSFAFKIPMFPFHIWLPEAHVEAPTVGSVLLAGVLLKLGVYGLLRYNLALFPDASLFFMPLVVLCGLLGVICSALTAIRQVDLKRIIAYSSVAHMNLILLGLFSFTFIGIEGAILQSLSHGFVASALFFLIGMLYSRYHSRSLTYYGGLVQVMPLYVFFFFIFTLANIALPGTSSFIGEFLLLTGICSFNFIVCFFSSLGVILGGMYSLWLYNRISFGNIKGPGIVKYTDLTVAESIILSILLLFVFILGLYPDVVYQYIYNSIVTSFIVYL